MHHIGVADWKSGTFVEPACGTGAFLLAAPQQVRAIGVEIDPVRAELARLATGREVIVGDFCEVETPFDVDCFVGNPPFDAKVIQGMLSKAHGMLGRDGFVSFILPAYVFQTSSKVLGYREQWSIYQDLMPRNIFPGLSLPLVLARFVKDGRRLLSGFFLYEEVGDVQQMDGAVRQALGTGGGKGSVWRSVVADAVAAFGGKAKLDQIYQYVEPKRPTGNPWWREQVRKVLQAGKHFQRDGDCWVMAA